MPLASRRSMVAVAAICLSLSGLTRRSLAATAEDAVQFEYMRLNYSDEELQGYYSSLRDYLFLSINRSRSSSQEVLLGEAERELLGGEHVFPLALEIRIFDFLADEGDQSEVLASEDWSTYRRLATRLIFGIWRRSSDSVDPSFDPTDRAVMRVCPPDTTRLPCGVNSQLIKDQEARREYEAAIVENEGKLKYLRDQTSVRSLMRRFQMMSEIYVAWYYSKDSLGVAELEQLAVSEIPDLGAREDIMEPIRSRLRETAGQRP